MDGKDNKEEETLEVAEGAFPCSELFEVRENIRLLLNTINEGEGDRVSLIWWKGGRGAMEADEIRESRENVKESNRIFWRDYCQKTFFGIMCHRIYMHLAKKWCNEV